MIYKIKIKKKVTKFLTKCDKHITTTFLNKIQTIKEDPYLAMKKLDISAITNADNLYRLRIWTYRFLFIINKNEIVITFFDADSRGWIYKQLK